MHLKSMMRQKFYLEELEKVYKTDLSGEAIKNNEGKFESTEFSKIKTGSESFVTVLMFGLKFEEVNRP